MGKKNIDVVVVYMIYVPTLVEIDLKNCDVKELRECNCCCLYDQCFPRGGVRSSSYFSSAVNTDKMLLFI